MPRVVIYTPCVAKIQDQIGAEDVLVVVRAITLQAICDRLESMREHTARGRSKWQPSSVRLLLERAEARGSLSKDTALN